MMLKYMQSSGLSFVLVLMAMVSLTGCIERTISITSEPSGALVHLNDDEVGRTPLTVPFTFYGVYDVRVEHEPVWMELAEAAKVLKLSEADVKKRLDEYKLDGRMENGKQQVRVYYNPLSTKQKADGPWWEFPGPDLLAEAIPGNKVELNWSFTLEPVTDGDTDAILKRAKAMRKQLDEKLSPKK